MPTCHTCGDTKTLESFNKDNRLKRGHRAQCKACCAGHIKRYKEGWKKYFIQKYGEHPRCECCGTTLGWFTGIASKSVHLDHCHGGTESISKPPGEWLQHKLCNEENIKIVESCHFGILCRKCNSLLPTMDRLVRLISLIRYAKRKDMERKSRERGQKK